MTVLNTNIKGQRGYDKAQSSFEVSSNDSLEEHKKNVDKYGWIFKG